MALETKEWGRGEMRRHAGVASKQNTIIEAHLERHHARQLIEDLQLPEPDPAALAGADDELMLAGAGTAPELD